MINPGVGLLLTGYSGRCSVTREHSSRPENRQRGPRGPWNRPGEQERAASQKIMVCKSLFTLFNAPDFLRSLIEHSSVEASRWDN